jgi:hypothetical protein
MSVGMSQRSANSRVTTAMVTDPDGNRVAFAEAIDPTLVR